MTRTLLDARPARPARSRSRAAEPPPPATAGASIETPDLAEIMSAFTRVTDRLQGAHQTLQAEVSRLNRELRETNEQLRRSRQLAALGQMAAGIAHEVRNPLGSIRLYASLLVDDLADRPESIRLARQIARAVSDLDAVVGDVLNFAREITIRPAPLGVGAALDQAIESCRAMMHEARIVVRRNAESEATLPPLLADASLLNQALVNVIRNAVEAMSGEGTLTLYAEVDPSEPPKDAGGVAAAPAILLKIDDTGPGIPEEISERIFNPFFTTRAAGTGLGLAIVHRIIDAHGGEIRIGRAEGGGASIGLRLPTALQADASAGSDPAVKVPVRRSSQCASS
ncbi:MAG: hypothetical protein KJZ69_13820 [Phycisphaerales bacterium]|nr:hypothetical protein [Phycisphaerales bacterium]